MSVDYKIGETIKILRTKAGVSQDTLAQALNISSQAVSKWETGKALPDIYLLPAIADYFHISIDSLFSNGVTIGSSDDVIRAFLDDVGLKETTRGYTYLFEIVSLLTEDPLVSVSSVVYEVAKRHGAGYRTIQMAIQYCLKNTRYQNTGYKTVVLDCLRHVRAQVGLKERKLE